MDKIIAKGKKIAAHLMEAAESDIEFKDGMYQVAGTDKKKAFAEVSLAAYVPHNYPHDKLEPGLNENAFYDPSNFTFPAGSYVCEVEVDPDTGVVDIQSFTAVDDFGKIINPMIVEGQVHGGLVQGVGQAMTEVGLYDTGSGQGRYLFPHRAELVGLQLAPMEPFSFTARDGLPIHAYLTFPPGVERAGLPAVLNVHGGPWARDAWGFDPEAQWLANRGYLCVQVNFRSSTGYGKTFLNAGDKQWGAAMQDDLTDAVEHVIAQGWVDRARVGIYGGSYGGYAVLAGAAFTPDLYRCGVDIVGPSNLVTLIESFPPYWAPILELSWYPRVGDPRKEVDRKDLLARSPITRVDAIRKPLLIGQGANDPRVTQKESDQIVAAMKAKSIPVTYVLYPDEGHGFARPENRISFFAISEGFLSKCLGGRYQPVDGDFAGSSLKVPEGADYVPGLKEAAAGRM
jgi:dienelactone hydrolase